MSKLFFKASEVAKLVAHSKGKPHPDKNYGEPLELKEYLYLVHDDGIYLMSGATEKLPNPKAGQVVNGHTEAANFVAYEKDCSPRKGGDYWNTARQLVGGDDFGEPVPLAMFEQALSNKRTSPNGKVTVIPKIKLIIVNFTDTQIWVTGLP